MTNTTARLGATLEEWNWATYHFGPDLLPAVADTRGITTISDRLRHLKSFAKTPSLVVGSHLRGIKAWAHYESTAQEHAAWSIDPSLNILLNTRRFRAIDIDVADQTAASALEDFFRQALNVPMLVRGRAGSGKRTLLIKLADAPHLSKRVIHLPNGRGAIEFLANGQQTALFGTHPDGERFVVRADDWNLPTGTVTLAALSSAWDTLRKAYDPSGAERWNRPLAGDAEDMMPVGPRTADTVSDDPVVSYLFEKGMVLEEAGNGMLHLQCPWASEHTSDTIGSTSWLPAGLGGKAEGGFRCLHSHCTGRDTHVFLRHIGYRDREATLAFTSAMGQAAMALNSGLPEGAAPVSTALTIDGARDNMLRAVAAIPEGATALQTAAMVAALPDALEQGFKRHPKTSAVEPTLTNAVLALSEGSPVAQIRFDTFLHQAFLKLPGRSKWEPFSDEAVSKVRLSIEAKYGFDVGHTETSRAMSMAACDNTFDSLAEHAKQLKWDGVKRVEGFAKNFLKAAPSAYASALSWYMWVALAARAICPGVKADMSPIFISPKQGTGKSSMVMRLALAPDHATALGISELGTDNASRRMLGKTVVEFAEFKGHASRDDETIKAFLTTQFDEWVPKYREFTTKYERRSLFFGTSNKLRILRDPTGNRRWLPMGVAVTDTHLDWPAMEADNDYIKRQLYAEALAVIDTFPSPQAAVEHFAGPANYLAEESRLAAMQLDPAFDRMRDYANKIENLGSLSLVGLYTAVMKAGGADISGLHEGMRARIESALVLLGYEAIPGSNNWKRVRPLL